MFQSTSHEKTFKSIKYLLMKKYALFLSLIIFYDNMTSVVYKVIVSIIYSIIDDFLCLYYLDKLQQKLSDFEKKFENYFNDLSGLDIPEILMNIMPCYGFSKVTASTVILTYRSDIVTYYLSK